MNPMALPFAPSPMTPTPMGRPLDPRLYSTGHITRTPVGGVAPLAPIRIPVWTLRAPLRSPTPPSPSYSPESPLEAPGTPTGRAEDTQVARPPRSPLTVRRYRLAAMVARMGERIGLCRRCRQKGLACVSIEGVTKCSACTRVGCACSLAPPRQLLPRPVVTHFIVDLLAVAGLAPSAKRAITQALTAD
ncbi:hypothetical protein B9479_008340 [Cryptococcus floricola]|uniref:Zn(2)-C6 fungal-type domain-containing protein n=1 Tax=Cryptococcus floricola TaxID=2591691 RepID=A0A5D3AKC3_9TREE|nr:hypothetical protein B9479_008340 [Cryptococcus floricola]